ncbi:MAG: alkaline phosphatase family protein [Chloroflexi bacterium]|nr:alkaline phosphatase family protein [Chloroflexota bacterium]
MSSGIQGLLEGARQGMWVLPSASEPNPVSLARALAEICGATSSGFEHDPVADRLRSLIGDPEHLVFVIADGFGMNFIRELDSDSFCRSNLALEGRVVFPSSTGPNLFSYGRAQWPGQHGNLGWFVHLAELGEHATLFPWARTRDNKSLAELGLTGGDVFPGDPVVPRYARDSRIFVPNSIAGSIATRALHGDGVVGYKDLHSVVDRVVERVRAAAAAPTYSHIYWSEIDRAAHEFGSGDPNTLSEVARLDVELGRLSRNLPATARVVVTADHGHLDYRAREKVYVDQADSIRQLLTKDHAGDDRVPMFHVRKGREDEFASEFERRFGDHFLLITAQELLDAELLGPDGISETTLPRLGHFIAIARRGAGLKMLTPENDRKNALVSQHGGLSPEEMLVPLIIA